MCLVYNFSWNIVKSTKYVGCYTVLTFASRFRNISHMLYVFCTGSNVINIRWCWGRWWTHQKYFQSFIKKKNESVSISTIALTHIEFTHFQFLHNSNWIIHRAVGHHYVHTKGMSKNFTLTERFKCFIIYTKIFKENTSAVYLVSVVFQISRWPILESLTFSFFRRKKLLLHTEERWRDKNYKIKTQLFYINWENVHTIF